MKQIHKLILSIFIVTILFGSYTHVTLGATQGDLCGGTGGNGEIVSLGSNTFTLRLNEGNNKGTGNLIVSLSQNAIIETSSGHVSLSDLKVGDRVTLVGDNNRNGTFTADTVVVCNTTQGVGAGINETNQTNPITVRNQSSEAYAKVSGTINIVTIVIVSLIWLGISGFLLLKKRKELAYILFFTIFYIYLYKVLDYTLLQFQSLLLIQHFVPGLMLNGFREGTNLNLIPLATLRLVDIKTSFLNILMMMPFGFGLPFITRFRLKKVVIIGLLVSILIELLQFITGFMANTTFRVADVNDLIFNTLGVAVGYIIFAQFILLFRRIFPHWKTLSNPILRYIAKRPQVNTNNTK